MPKLLLGGSDDEEDNSGLTGGTNKTKLTINENYATAYERWRRKEEYQKLKDKYGEDILSEDSVASADDDESDDESDDDSSDVDETIFDQQFLKVYGALKARDPHIYDEKVRFFEEEGETDTNKDAQDEDDEDDDGNQQKTRKDKKMNLLEYHVNLVRKEKGITEEDRAMENGDIRINPKHGPDKASYVQEMESIKKEFKNILKEDDGDGEDGDDCLIKGVKKVAVRERKPDPLEVLRDASKSDKRIGFLANYWEKKDLDERENFLKEYILKKKYLDPTDREDNILTARLSTKGQSSTSEFASSSSFTETNANANENENADDEDEDEDDNGNDNVQGKQGMPVTSKLSLITEKATNYHFQETDPEVIKRYPREVESVRNLTGSTSRNAKRNEIKERKSKEKREALQRFRELRREEVKAKLQKLTEISGNERLLTDNQIDIDTIVDDITNFDPEKYDQCMSSLFDEQFYDVTSNPNHIKLTKPKFEYIPGIDDVDDNLNPINQGEGSSAEIEDATAAGVATAPDEEEEEDIGGDDDDDDGPSTSKGKKKKINKKKTEKTPAEKKNIGIYEDLIAGEVPTRFRYRKVPANDFGLSPEELLFAEDKELNRWVSLKKTCQHRTLEEEKYDIKIYGRKGKDYSLKKKILQSVYNPKDGEDEEEQQLQDDDDEQDKQQPKSRGNNESSRGNIGHSRKRKRYEDRELEKMNLTADRLRSYDLPFRAIKALKGKLHRQRNARRTNKR